MESVINKAIEWFKNISGATKELTSGNVSHKSCAIRGIANRSAEYLEKHKEGLSAIRWQTGEPKENGTYLVSIKGIESHYVTCAMYNCLTRWCHWKKEEIIAWCKLSDIEPYKEETK